MLLLVILGLVLLLLVVLLDALRWKDAHCHRCIRLEVAIAPPVVRPRSDLGWVDVTRSTRNTVSECRSAVVLCVRKQW